ncbi:thiol-disulfide isomerase/thioredoxin [Luteibacter sp. Sphag1AF]|uniref:TlpA family protein disulfide reductase n=1 Tax=Luteibacter sp. Sphag1AF TaxID=2587031 RepID=UPI0016173277|nr:TlpA disulfide reductase family protein [Luteibacter sp. Sphag1AF]MBB3226120.1 thiol-disulfide isomerase/thioredoxin [Luteibacter sp. Sphag1AF]
MARGPTFWFVIASIVAAGAGAFVQHRMSAPVPAAAGMAVAGIGDMRPNATYVDVNGRPHPMANWNGKRVLLNFWATWCSPCRQEMPLLDATSKTWADRNVVVVGIAEDTAADVRAYLIDFPVSYPIVLAPSDAPGSSQSMGNAQHLLPFSVLLGPDGRILRRKVGPLSQEDLDEWLGAPPR